ncbi:hypothetical protein H8356DRAFT_1323016 [Neocallimastix lanati (nom. inval.)]|nr:hypothetical protein H8356DRAFT_1323016 [Neocallimastix sp. JGI-2020a]
MDEFLNRKGEDNRTSSCFLKHIRFLLNSLPYCFGVETDLFLSKVNMKDIPYMSLNMMGFFSSINKNNYHSERTSISFMKTLWEDENHSI